MHIIIQHVVYFSISPPRYGLNPPSPPQRYYNHGGCWFQIGAFFMINLCLVVIATQFSETKKRETERMLQERKRFHSSSTLASNSEPGGCYDEIIKYIAHLWRRAKRKLKRYFRQAPGRRQRKVTPERAISLRRKRRKKRPPGQVGQARHRHPHLVSAAGEADSIPGEADSVPGSDCGPGGDLAPHASPEVSDVDPVASPRRPNHLPVPGEAASTQPSTESLPGSFRTSGSPCRPAPPPLCRASSLNTGVREPAGSLCIPCIPSPQLLGATPPALQNVTTPTQQYSVNKLQQHSEPGKKYIFNIFLYYVNIVLFQYK